MMNTVSKVYPVNIFLQASKVIIVVFLLLGATACKKGNDVIIEDPIEDETPTTGSEYPVITTYQIVEIEPNSHPFTKDSYQATFDGISFELIKNDKGKLTFMVPYEITEGDQELRIPELGNDVWAFHVIPSSFKALVSPEVFDNLVDRIKTEIPGDSNPNTDEDIQLIMDQLDEIVASASPEEKRKISLYYLEHQHIIDQLIFADFDELAESQGMPYHASSFHPNSLTTAGLGPQILSSSSLISSDVDKETAILLAKFTGSVVLLGGGAVLLVYGPTIEKVIGIGAMAIGMSKARKFKRELDSKNIKLVRISYENLFNRGFRNFSGTSSGMKNATTTQTQEPIYIEFDQDTPLPIFLKRRPLTLEDEDDSNTLIKDFFSTYNWLIDITTTLNTAIDWVNRRVPFVSYELVPQPTLPEETEEVNYPLTPDIMENLQISHRGYSSGQDYMMSHQLDEEGRLVLNVKPSSIKWTEDQNFTLLFKYTERYHNIESEIEFRIDACSAVQRLLDNGESPQDLFQRFYEPSCMVGKSYGGGVIGLFQQNAYCAIVTNQPIGAANFHTAISTANSYSSQGFSDWFLSRYSQPPIYYVAYRNVINHYQQQGIPVSTTGYIWLSDIYQAGTPDKEGEGYAYQVSTGMAVPQTESSNHSVWPIRVVHF